MGYPVLTQEEVDQAITDGACLEIVEVYDTKLVFCNGGAYVLQESA